MILRFKTTNALYKLMECSGHSGNLMRDLTEMVLRLKQNYLKGDFVYKDLQNLIQDFWRSYPVNLSLDTGDDENYFRLKGCSRNEVKEFKYFLDHAIEYGWRAEKSGEGLFMTHLKYQDIWFKISYSNYRDAILVPNGGVSLLREKAELSG